MKKAVNTVIDFLNTLFGNEVGVYAAQATFFMILSVFPLIMLILTLVGFTDISEEYLISIVSGFVPAMIDDLVEQIIYEIYSSASGMVLSVAAVIVIWAASKGVFAITVGMRKIFGTTSESNFVKNRLLSMLYVIIFVVAIVFALVLLVFGNSIFHLIMNHITFIHDYSRIIIFLKFVISIVVLSALFVAIFKTARCKKYRFRDYLLGAVISALGWYVFSYIFSLYVSLSANFSYMYGSLSAIIVLMLWLYFCTYILFVGAQIVAYKKHAGH